MCSVVNLDGVVDRVMIMMKQEESDYLYSNYLPHLQVSKDGKFNPLWREKICHWSYNVTDHFDLGREVVAISLDLFDRFLATQGNACDGNLALLTSVTTLHLAIKLHEKKKIRISTLATLSRGQFRPKHIEDMEWVILKALSWKLHPPTAYSFIFHLLLFLPTETSQVVRKDIYELSKYLAELAICDSFFVEKRASVVAFAAILNVMDDIPFSRMPGGLREKLLKDLSVKLHLDHKSPETVEVRDRLTLMFAASNNSDGNDHSVCAEKENLHEVSPDPSGGSYRCGNRGLCSSSDGKNSFRYSPSPRGNRTRVAASPISGTTSRPRVSSSPLVFGMR